MSLQVWAAVVSLEDGSITAPTIIVSRNALSALAIFPQLNRWFTTESHKMRDVCLFYVMPLPQEVDAQEFVRRLEAELPFSAASCVEWLREAGKRFSEDADGDYDPKEGR